MRRLRRLTILAAVIAAITRLRKRSIEKSESELALVTSEQTTTSR